jgi:glycerate 2-kinase
MKIVIAPDSFKGSVSSSEACEAIAQGIRRVVSDARIVSIPMADGGEGTVNALVTSTQGQLRTVTVTGPLGEPVDAAYGILGTREGNRESVPMTAVIEMSAAAGLTLIPDPKRNPLHTTTHGVGQLIRDALDQDCRDFIIGIGGSGTNDGGTGMAQAIGVRFLDQDQNEITEPMTGLRMDQVDSIDISQLDPRIAESNFVVACDVQNPLLGPTGATRTYGPQKGADAEALEILETNMTHIITKIENHVGKAIRDIPGTGAAGGIGLSLIAFTNAKLQSGVDIVLRYSRFAERAAGADLILTGEGRIDGQTIYGKTVAGVAAAAQKLKIPVIALAGSIGPDAHKVLDIGVSAYLSINPGPITLEQAIRTAREYLADTAEQVIRISHLS